MGGIIIIGGLLVVVVCPTANILLANTTKIVRSTFFFEIV
jgi:hypothetical protein